MHVGIDITVMKKGEEPYGHTWILDLTDKQTEKVILEVKQVLLDMKVI